MQFFRVIGRSLRSIGIVFSHEFNLFFASPIVYLIGAVWLFLAGGFFALSLGAINTGQYEPDMLGMFSPMVFLMIFMAPALTMRLVAEEYRNGTNELLYTAPVRDWEVIFAKWLAVWAVFSVFMLISLVFPLILFSRGNPDPGLVITGYLGLWLMAGMTLALGIFASSLTQYQLVAFFVTMGTLLVLWLAQQLTYIITSPKITPVLSEISLVSHYQNLISRAIIDPIDIGYFIGIIAVFLFLATQMLNTRRWSS